MENKKYTIFGNVLPRGAVSKARRTFERFARKFDFDPRWKPELASVGVGYPYHTFGIRSLVAGGESSGAEPVDAERGIVLGTIRMGYGHYRIALSLASAAHALGYTPYWLDFMAFPESTASRVISHFEHLYNFGSRLSQRSSLFNRLFWEKFTSEAGRKLSVTAQNMELARLFAPLCAGLPPNVPFISTHPWTGAAARAAGLERVITAIPDNYPVAFNLVENSVHVVQTHSSYFGYRMLRGMGEDHENLRPMPDDQLAWVGQYVDPEIVEGIPGDCEARLRRIREKRTRRVLLTTGGAGAQTARFREITRFCRERLATKRVALFINMGDHSRKWEELKRRLDEDRIGYTLHHDWEETQVFCRNALESDVSGVHVFLHDDIFAAVYSTNLLMRASDLLVTKPSELSYYPVPKLFIQRVGRHEAWGAIHGAEIGDGTMETESVGSMLETLGTILDENDILTMYCSAILRNKEAGLYDGAYRAVKLAVGGADSKKQSDAPHIA